MEVNNAKKSKENITSIEEISIIYKKMIENLLEFKNKVQQNNITMIDMSSELETFLRNVKEIQLYRDNFQKIDSIITNSTEIAKTLIQVSQTQDTTEETQIINSINELIKQISFTLK